jgi:hypothetical protein
MVVKSYATNEGARPRGDLLSPPLAVLGRRHSDLRSPEQQTWGPRPDPADTCGGSVPVLRILVIKTPKKRPSKLKTDRQRLSVFEETPIQIRSATGQHTRHGGVSGGGKGRGQGL